jgi:lipopolysaccharide transport system permease protein
MEIFIRTLAKNRQLTGQLVLRDVAGRYKGSQLGIAWTVINPLLMLAVYTLVFSQIFRARWGSGADSQSPLTFAINLFAGLIVFNFFAECAARSSSLITTNPNYVKKIVFPLDALGSMVTGSALVHALTSTVILLVVKLAIDKSIPVTAFLLPVVWLPLGLGCLGLTWLLSTIGVYIRDISQLISAAISMLMFLSPVFYPTSALPDGLKWLSSLNPLAVIMEQTRAVLIDGTTPEPKIMVTEIILAVLWCEVCIRILKQAQPYFGDML